MADEKVEPLPGFRTFWEKSKKEAAIKNVTFVQVEPSGQSVHHVMVVREWLKIYRHSKQIANRTEGQWRFLADHEWNCKASEHSAIRRKSKTTSLLSTTVVARF